MTEKINYNLTPHVEELTEIMIDLILSKFDNIAIIAMYGSRARGDYHPTSDLEFFAITDTDDTSTTAESDTVTTSSTQPSKPTFLFNGISVDVGIHPRDHYEKIAKREGYWVVPAGTVAMAKIVYSRSAKDRTWYEQIRQQINEDHQDPDIYHLDEAESTYQNMVKALGQLSLAKLHDDLYEAHNNIGSLLICYAIVLAQANGRYLINNWGKNIDDTLEFPAQPQGTAILLEELVVETDLDQICELACQLVDKVRLFLLERDTEPLEETELEMLDSVNGLEYLYKMDKAIATDHMPALSYVIADSEQLYAKDLLKIQEVWKSMSHLYLYSEFANHYHEEYPHLRKLMLEGDMDALREGIAITWDKIKSHIQSKIDLPNFTRIEEIKPYFADT